MNDRADKGNLQQNMIQFSTGYTRKIYGESNSLENSLFMSLGTSLSLNQLSTNLDNLWFGRQFNTNLLAVDTSLPSGENFIFDNISFINLNVGLRWLYLMEDNKSLSSGFAINNFNRPNISFRENPISLQTKLTFFFESQFNLGHDLWQRPGVVVTIQNPSYQIIPSYNVVFRMNDEDSTMEIGIASRLTNRIGGIHADAIILLFGLSNKEYRFGFSFDFNVSPLSQFTNGNGALEISFDYTLPTKPK